jgi:A/G-specific adenine glycosylase
MPSPPSLASGRPSLKRKAPPRRGPAPEDRGRRFRSRLLAWYTRHQRRLPWRGVRDPWAVLVSEIMLQQTQVTRVVEFYPRFLARYPTAEDLAAAPADAVRESWDGLGYYARARNLHAAARRIASELGGTMPRTVGELCRLPGIGRYTAGAVASLAFGEPVAAIDTNAARVLARVFRVRGRRGSARREHRLWALGSALVPPARPADWNQALMDLGATICVARAPRCPVCPVRRVCASSADRRGQAR